MSVGLKYKALIGLAVIVSILVTAVASFAGTINYTYDSLNRLTKVDYGNGTTIAYTYDAAGNRLTMTSSTSTVKPTPTPTPTATASEGLQVEGGGHHSLALKSDGTVWTWGRNDYGQLGDGSYTNRDTPVQVSKLSGITAITGGFDHSLAIKTDGTVLAWGNNGNGELGDGTNTQRTKPAQVSTLNNIIKIAGGGWHSLALKSDGTVWAWGFNDGGQLGNNTTTNSNTPVYVSSISDVISIAGGWGYSLALKSDGTVWAWGWNGSGQLGDGTTENSRVPVQVSELDGITGIAGGGWHSIALKSDGTVWAWGENSKGQLGDETTTNRNVPVQVTGLSNITAIAAGVDHAIALKSDGTVWTWGYNGNGELGEGTTANSSMPLRVSNLSEVIAIAAGKRHSLGLKSDGTVWAWGMNSYGQLGDGTTNESHVPVQVKNLNLSQSAIPTPSPRATPTPTAIPKPTPTPTTKPTPVKTSTPSPTPTSVSYPTPSPTLSPTPTSTQWQESYDFNGVIKIKLKKKKVVEEVDGTVDVTMNEVKDSFIKKRNTSSIHSNSRKGVVSIQGATFKFKFESVDTECGDTLDRVTIKVDAHFQNDGVTESENHIEFDFDSAAMTDVIGRILQINGKTVQSLLNLNDCFSAIGGAGNKTAEFRIKNISGTAVIKETKTVIRIKGNSEIQIADTKQQNKKKYSQKIFGKLIVSTPSPTPTPSSSPQPTAAVTPHAKHFKIPKAPITIDGNMNDWNDIEPVFVDNVNDEDQDANYEGTDLYKFYLAKDDTFLYLMMTLYDGTPKTDMFTVYGFQANQTPKEYDSPGDIRAFAAFQDGEWYASVHKVTNSEPFDSTEIVTYNSSKYVGAGSNFIEWKVSLSDMRTLDEKYVRVWIHPHVQGEGDKYPTSEDEVTYIQIIDKKQ